MVTTNIYKNNKILSLKHIQQQESAESFNIRFESGLSKEVIYTFWKWSRRRRTRFIWIPRLQQEVCTTINIQHSVLLYISPFVFVRIIGEIKKVLFAEVVLHEILPQQSFSTQAMGNFRLFVKKKTVGNDCISSEYSLF